MKLRRAVFALALILGMTGLAEAKKKPVYAKHKAAKTRVAHKHNAKKANKAANKALAKHRKHAA
jgi:hypothetical protein